MSDSQLHAALEKHILTWKDWVTNYFPQQHPKMKQKQANPLTCYRCGKIKSDINPCTYHEDVYILSVPTKHVGLVMGKGKTKLLQILSSSGLSRLTVPNTAADQADLELKGVPAAVVAAEEMIGRAVQRQVRLAPGRWRCCQHGVRDGGCETCLVHVMDTVFLDKELLVETGERNSDSVTARVFALDCEWVYTSRGGELARVTILDWAGTVCYDRLVLPPRAVRDYNTRFSGITQQSMDGVTTSLMEVQLDLIKIISSKDIIVGHSLQHDLQALHLVHRKVVDTSLVFPHKDGLPKRNSLRFLAKHFLMRNIQEEPKGHDSIEDALACLDLMKLKI